MGDFEAFYRANLRMVHALAFSRTTDQWQAEDLTQDTFLRAWQHFHRLSGLAQAAQRAWLVRTLRNLATDVWRRRNRCSNAVGEIEEQKEKAAGETELRLDLAQALARLDEADRELVTLRYLEELNSREIGEALGLPEGTVRRRLARCRKLLAQHLSQWGGGGEGR